MRSASTRLPAPLDAEFLNIASFRFHRQGRYDFGLTLGLFVPPPTTTSAVPIEQPGPILDSLGTIGLSDDSLFEESGGLRVIFSDGTCRAGLDIDAPAVQSSKTNEQNEDPEALLDSAPDVNVEFDSDFSSRLGAALRNIAPERQETLYETVASERFLGDFDQETPNDNFSPNLLDHLIDLSHGLNTNQNAPSASQETAFSASNHSNPTARLSTHSPGSPHTLASSNPRPPGPFTCGHCSATFKRPGDLKRHEKVHFPGQRTFHCWLCGRNGRKGFYRRDKLRDHEKKVHEF